MKTAKLAIVVCTYQRSQLLEKLLADIAKQSVLPEILIVVDGDPASGKVLKVVNASFEVIKKIVIYQPSNHANLSYQRYLAWRHAKAKNAEYLLYFDDDLRLRSQSLIQEMLGVMEKHPEAAGLTMPSETGDPEKFEGHDVLMDTRRKSNPQLPSWTKGLGSSSRLLPGQLTPVGHRIPVVLKSGQDVYPVEWLQGRVMFYSMRSLDESCFSEDLFALTHVKCGLGEDTFLARQANRKGELLWYQKKGIEHPDDDLPNSYPVKPFRFGFASAYSRRFLNDHYRYGKPSWGDRLALFRAYLGEAAVYFIRFISSPRWARAVYLGGYLSGCLKGLFVSPKAMILTPGIDWRRDAEEALKNALIQESPSDTSE